MPSLVTANEMSLTATMFNNIFDTWSRPIIVYKEPIKTQVVPQDSSALFGFGPTQGIELFTYAPVTGIFQGLIRYQNRYASKEKGDEFQSEIDEYIADGPVSIKVRSDCKDFIMYNGKTQRLEVDGFPYILSAVDPRPQLFWNTEFYIFDLERKF